MSEKKKNTEERLDDRAPSSTKVKDFVKYRYEEEFTRKEYLDEKANNTMNIASMVTTIYGGLGIVAATSLFNEAGINLSVVVLLTGLSLLIGSIILAAKSYLLKEYHYALRDNYYAEINTNNVINYKENIQKDIRMSDDEFDKDIIKSYSKCLAINYKSNEKKANELGYSQKIFLIGVASIPLFAFFAILS